MEIRDLTQAIRNIDIEDLEYVERDLCFMELASLALLLYGADRTTAEIALQKLLVMSNAANISSMAVATNILSDYARSINKNKWPDHIIEALAIINARRVLRKLGFKWKLVRQHYLPHITEISVYIHPLLKALYKICDNLTPVQAGHLIIYMDENHRSPQNRFRFYNSECLEVYLLDWIKERIISTGDREFKGARLQILFEYFKLNDLEEMKTILIDTVEQNASEGKAQQTVDSVANAMVSLQVSSTNESTKKEHDENDECTIENGMDTKHNESNDRYSVNFETAGIALIINEKRFHKETDPELQELLLEGELPERTGTDVDKEKLIETFKLFGYKPIIHEDLTHTEILSEIEETAKRSVLLDSLVVCILSHGIKGSVFGSNSIPVSIADIEQKLTAEALRNKPKFLIIQACQTTKSKNLNETERQGLNPINYTDILKAMATLPGFPSVRDKNNGTWFIQSLCNAIIQRSEKKHLYDILTVVTNEVSQKRGNAEVHKMTPVIISTLRREFFLPKRKIN